MLVKALDRNGEWFTLEADDPLVACIQHEMDHLDGKLFVDYLSNAKRTLIRKKLQKQQKHQPITMKVVFAGTPEFVAGHLKALINSHHEVSGVVCQPDKPGKRGKKLVIGPVKEVAIDAGLEVLQPAKLSIAALEQLNFDLLAVVAYGQILRSAILDYPRFGCINVHASLLPRWRAAPVQRSILAGIQSLVTIMQIDEGLDTGDISDQVFYD